MVKDSVTDQWIKQPEHKKRVIIETLKRNYELISKHSTVPQIIAHAENIHLTSSP